MRIEITDATANGQTYYRFILNDGPNGIDTVQGFGTDLIEVFSKIIEWREKIANDYIDTSPYENETLG
jgi:hypothetical protein